MTRTIDSATLAVYRSATPTTVPCLVITRTDAQVYRLVGHDRDLTVAGQVFESAPGLDISSLVGAEGFAPDNAEFKVLDSDDAVITRADLYAGIWNSAAMQVGMVDWAAATPVVDVLKQGRLGIAKPKRGYFTLEFRDLRQAAQDAHETVLQPTCRYRLGDARCTKDVTGAPFTVAGTLTAVTSGYSVTDAARTEAADWFGDGMLTFTSGANAGLAQKVKTYAGGVFVFWQQFVFPIAPGDAYTAVAGCRFRFVEDCQAKFDNAVNFGGEPNKRNPDILTAPATA